MALGKKSGGRVRGVANKRSLQREMQVAAEGLTPLAYLLQVLRNEANDLPVRLDAAKSAAPYVHPKLAQVQLNHGGHDGGPLALHINFITPRVDNDDAKGS